jgi:hypothetical protein
MKQLTNMSAETYHATSLSKCNKLEQPTYWLSNVPWGVSTNTLALYFVADENVLPTAKA